MCIRDRYIGWSAGANLACPTIRTTNDMPIVDPQGFDALNLFPLQINPHFTNALPEGHKGETREQRIRELLVVAPELTIIGLPEGNWITVSKGHATLGGPNTTYVFKAGDCLLYTSNTAGSGADCAWSRTDQLRN